MLFNFALNILLSVHLFFHPYFISLSEIKYNQGSKKLEIAQKIFWDDLETELSAIYGQKVDFLKPSDAAKLDQMIKEYLLSKQEIIVNGQKVTLQYLGYEIEEDAAWFYYESGKVSAPKTVDIKMTLLVNQFPGQQNIVNFYVHQKTKSLLLDKNKTQGKLQF
jgi:hypothetical protein